MSRSSEGVFHGLIYGMFPDICPVGPEFPNWDSVLPGPQSSVRRGLAAADFLSLA